MARLGFLLLLQTSAVCYLASACLVSWKGLARSASCHSAETGRGRCGIRPMDHEEAQGRHRRPSMAMDKVMFKIVGGRVARRAASPWQASVQVIDEVHPGGRLTSTHICGGTVLGELWVLSAAHCFHGLTPSSLVVRLGEYNIHKKEKGEQHFRVREIIEHPLFDSVSYDYDIALLKLKTVGCAGIRFTDFVQPACLPTADSQYTEGETCHVFGWGTTKTHDPSRLRDAEVPLLSDSQCQELHGHVSPRMLCAGPLQGGVDSCYGDSGGPLICRHQHGGHTVVGVTSWGVGCGKRDLPGVYTKVSKFLDWLDSSMGR